MEALETEVSLFRYRFKEMACVVETLHPAYFALVMATGIVAISAHLEGLRIIAVGLSWFNAVAFIVLWIMYLLRLAFYPRSFLRDIADFERGPGYLTLVAGFGVAGSQTIIIFGYSKFAVGMWVTSIPLWFCLIYAVFAALIVKEHKPSLDKGINGGWLIAVVATQSISILGTLLSPYLSAHEQGILFFTLSLWLCGGMLYFWLISLIFYRYTFFHFSPADLTPSYWIDMGAMAISTLAGTALIESSSRVPFLSEMLPFLRGLTVFYWATATWWIPMLVILEVWRHVYKRFKLIYDPLYWGSVFPLGTYSAATHRLSDVFNMLALVGVQHVFAYIGLAAWLLTFLGLVRTLLSSAKEIAP
jgi:tellurite resistance protein TehA-like permease